MKRVMQKLISDVQVSGGLLKFGNGTHAPASDPSWIDLGETVLEVKDELEALGEPVELTIIDISDEYMSCDEYDDSGA